MLGIGTSRLSVECLLRTGASTVHRPVQSCFRIMHDGAQQASNHSGFVASIARSTLNKAPVGRSTLSAGPHAISSPGLGDDLGRDLRCWGRHHSITSFATHRYRTATHPPTRYPYPNKLSVTQRGCQVYRMLTRHRGAGEFDAILIQHHRCTSREDRIHSPVR